MDIEQINRLIRNVQDFPKKGVVFKDFSPVLENGAAFGALVRHLTELVPPPTDKIVAIESRGFILGAALAQVIGCGLVIVRKPGKLPGDLIQETYDLEYGSDTLEMNKMSLKPGDRVTIVDDVLATGGTASAVERLCEKQGADILGSVFMLEIAFLKGRDRLKCAVNSLIAE